MNTQKGRSKFKEFLILLDSGCSSTILMVSLIEKLNHIEDYAIQWKNKAVNITINLKIEIGFNLPELIATTP